MLLLYNDFAKIFMKLNIFLFFFEKIYNFATEKISEIKREKFTAKSAGSYMYLDIGCLQFLDPYRL